MRLKPRHDKTNKMSVRPAKTQIGLGVRPVWSESSLCAQWVAKDPMFLHADNDDSDQTGRMPRLIWVFAGRTLILFVLSCRGSLTSFQQKVAGLTALTPSIVRVSTLTSRSPFTVHFITKFTAWNNAECFDNFLKNVVNRELSTPENDNNLHVFVYISGKYKMS